MIVLDWCGVYVVIGGIVRGGVRFICEIRVILGECCWGILGYDFIVCVEMK